MVLMIMLHPVHHLCWQKHFAVFIVSIFIVASTLMSSLSMNVLQVELAANCLLAKPYWSVIYAFSFMLFFRCLVYVVGFLIL